MNLLCPNCQKMLTVPEQFAGQLMKCPLCNGTFTVPALPAGGESAPSFTPSPSTSATPSSAPEPTGSSAPAFSTGSQTPAFTNAPAEPAFMLSPPPPPPKSAANTSSNPTTQTSSSSASSTSGPGIYTHTFRLQANERILQWVPPVAMVLIFILQFFSWVGVYPGGVTAVTQNAWQAAFGGYTEDKDMREKFRILTEAKARDFNEDPKREYDEVSNEPGISLLLLFYLVPFFLVTLVVSIGVVVLPLVNVKLPPQIQQFLPLKWAILAGLNAVLLLFLGLQLLLNFSLESTTRNWIDHRPDIKKEKADTKAEKQAEAARGILLQWVQRTIWLKLTFALHVLATLSAGLVYWMEKRGSSHPPPCLEARW